ncbi:MAG: primosomal protein N' [Syntrophobacterales bacterium]|jgi:primosomal protein N' (replication factor Y)|nr:primosomal protein N' [Syntrophobacterales bacterium]
MMFVKTALNIPTDKTFTYAVPDHLLPEVKPGKRVFVPFGKTTAAACILELLTDSDRRDTRHIISILDHDPLFGENDLLFYQWLASYYMQPLGRVLFEILPKERDARVRRWILPGAAFEKVCPDDLGAEEHLLLNLMAENTHGILQHQAQKVMPAKTLAETIKNLQKKKIIRCEDRPDTGHLSKRYERWVKANPPDADRKLTAKQHALLKNVISTGEMSLSVLKQREYCTPSILKALHEKGYIEFTEKRKSRQPFSIFLTGEIESSPPPSLNQNQRKAVEKIVMAFSSSQFSVMLLHGVTGSGKTEVYIAAAKKVIASGGDVLFLAPEISLAIQLAKRIQPRFPGMDMAILHSEISPSLRYEQWLDIHKGEIKIVVGARSAVFAPLKNLKLIVVDEEHDESYKQDERFRYHGRDAAIMRGKLSGATVVLGSATPSIQTFFHAQLGRYTYLSLPDRVENRSLPEVTIVPMENERNRNTISILSPPLISAMSASLAGGYQILLFLNQRGFHTFFYCPDCRHTISCPNCTVSLTYHRETEMLHCHYCGHQEKASSICPNCGKERIIRYGTGTERLEAEVRRHFPGAAIGRMDRDTATGKNREMILSALERREIDILVGTQMITKGHDFPHINLVGIVSADLSLNIPDFRAAERTFQLLTQVSGRSGRGDIPGRVIIQTVNPDYYVLQKARDQDYHSFYQSEIKVRKTLIYPPFSRLVALHLSAPHKNRAEKAMETLRQAMAAIKKKTIYNAVEIIGPSHSPIEKLYGQYRWQILLKGKNISHLHSLAQDIILANKSKTLKITPDVDPIRFL